ncbi:terpene cyclase/mutase family protein [bacterium]|nr:terpene cyclase/mutase family protein [bacterium]MDB2429776.1 terpene cyclase/mutase family protein [Akkermansiaceae bacterium]
MSLHAALSTEAKERLDAQKRLSSITSLIIGLLVTFLIGIILFIISMAINKEEVVIDVVYSAPGEEEQELVVDKVNITRDVKPTPPSGGAPAKVIAAVTATPIAVPVTFAETDNVSFGTDEGFDDGFGAGAGGGGGGLPGGVMGKRCNAGDRSARLMASGGTSQCEEATMKALRWLKKMQNKDGSWDKKYPSAITGLALLAFLGHCETPESVEFGDAVFSATTFLVDLGMKKKGKLSTDLNDRWCYEHAIATYALCESYSFSQMFGYQIPNLDKVVQNSVQWIINNQNQAGGWNYRYEEHPRWDTSITAWHLQALKAAKNTGLEFKNLERCSKAALQAVLDTQQEHGGFGYGKSGPSGSSKGHFSLTGAGTLCVQQHKGNNHAAVGKGRRYMDKHNSFDFKKYANLYDHYYTSQAMINLGGKSWKVYNQLFRDELIKNQAKDGSWGDPAGNHHSAGKTYNTCLATLMLEVYYRYLPGTGAGR